MKNCPQCGQPRQGEAFKCPDCDVFYSQLDEILFAEQQRQEAGSLKARLKRIVAADYHKQAARDEVATLWNETPLTTKITLFTIGAFVFALIVTVL